MRNRPVRAGAGAAGDKSTIRCDPADRPCADADWLWELELGHQREEPTAQCRAVVAHGRRLLLASYFVSAAPAQYVTRPARCVQASKTSSAPSHGTFTIGSARASNGFASSL